MPSATDPSSSGAVTIEADLQQPELIIVHPLVLLSVVDHYQRSAVERGKRVVGVLLGSWTGRTVNITNSYAIPFEESESNPTVWYLDHNYHENMSELYKKINAKEKPVGWYHSGPKLRPSDMTIQDLMRRYCPSPVLCIIDPQCNEGAPVQSYSVVGEELSHDGAHKSTRTFAHLNTVIEADESEAVGVENLLRDVQDGAISNLHQAINTKVCSLATLAGQLEVVEEYLRGMLAGKLPVRQSILASVQEMFNLLPDVHSEESQRALTVKTNDQLAMIYTGSLTRSVIAINELISNKLEATQLSQ